jgi:hypothetical protein
MNEKEFTAQDMIEFAKWYASDMSVDDIDEHSVQSYRTHLVDKERREYERYLELKAKYEK